jgi:phenylacetate-CoA ligase
MEARLSTEKRGRRGILTRAAGTLAILRTWPGQQRIPFLPRAEIEQRRDQRLRETISYAARHVPRYRGVDPREITGTASLPLLPLVTRDDVVADPLGFRSNAVRLDDSLVVRTSGTTGEPLDVLHDRRSLLANIAYSERERAVDKAVLGRDSGYRVLVLEYSAGTLLDVRAFYDAASFRPRRPPQNLVPSELGVDEAIAAIERQRPHVIVGPGSWLSVVFRTLHDRPATHLPELVVYGSSALSGARDLIEAELGIPVLSRYAAAEAFKIGFFCERREGFHLHEDLCHVELVDDKGSPVDEGEVGYVVLSNLVNRGTVLLRYGLGDRARLTTARCSCGRTSPRLHLLEGKTVPLIRLPDGSLLHSRGLWGVIKRIEGVRRFQLIQHEPARFEIRLATTRPEAFDLVASHVVSGLERLLPGCHVTATRHDRLGMDGEGKFEPMVTLAEGGRDGE